MCLSLTIALCSSWAQCMPMTTRRRRGPFKTQKPKPKQGFRKMRARPTIPQHWLDGATLKTSHHGPSEARIHLGVQPLRLNECDQLADVVQHRDVPDRKAEALVLGVECLDERWKALAAKTHIGERRVHPQFGEPARDRLHRLIDASQRRQI